VLFFHFEFGLAPHYSCKRIGLYASSKTQSDEFVNVADLTNVTAGNLMFKYADDTFIVGLIPAANANSRSAELDHVDGWGQNNNLRIDRAKSAEIIFTNCNRKPAEGLSPQILNIRRVTSSCLASP